MGNATCCNFGARVQSGTCTNSNCDLSRKDA
jgi:hypothetical protein